MIFDSMEQGIDMATYLGIYTAVYNISSIVKTDRELDQENENLYIKLSAHIEKQVGLIREVSRERGSEALLEFFIDQWQRYGMTAKYINNIFRYFNRHFIKRRLDEGQKDMYDIYTLHLIKWKTGMFDFFHEKAIGCVLDLVDRQRNGEMVGYTQIRKYIDSFGKFSYEVLVSIHLLCIVVALNIDDPNSLNNTLGIELYRTVFETPFCQASLRHYQQKSAELLVKHDIVEYMRRVCRVLKINLKQKANEI